MIWICLAAVLLLALPTVAFADSHDLTADAAGGAATTEDASAEASSEAADEAGAGSATTEDAAPAEDGGFLSGVDEEPESNVVGLGSTILRLIVALAVTIALIYGVVWVLKFLGIGGVRTPRTPQGSIIHAVSSTNLTPHHTVHLVKVADKLLIVGVFDKGMTLLAEINDEETLSHLDEEIGQSEESFADLLDASEIETEMSETRVSGMVGQVGPGNWLQEKIETLRHYTARTAGRTTNNRGRLSRKDASSKRSKVVSPRGDDEVGKNR